MQRVKKSWEYNEMKGLLEVLVGSVHPDLLLTLHVKQKESL